MTSGFIAISNILNHLLDFYRISEAELSRKVQLPRATINRLVSGKTPDPRASTLEAIADYFHITLDQLLGKQPLFLNGDQSVLATSNVPLPIISWQDCKNWRNSVSKLTTESHPDWLMVDSSMHDAIFALKVYGDAMWPNFPQNSVLIIAAKQPINKNFIIIQKNDEVIFRQLIMDGEFKFLKAINPIFPILQLDEEDNIIGVIVQTRNFLT